MTGTRAPASERQRRTLPTSEAYNLWASTYDSDGNILQALDSLALEEELLPLLLKQLVVQADSHHLTLPAGTLRVLDFGCGTGRAIQTLIAQLRGPMLDTVEELLQGNAGMLEVHFVGLDASSGMLDVARRRIPPLQTIYLDGPLMATLVIRADFYEYDMLTSQATHLDTQGWLSGYPDVILSTLVLEHIDIDSYFSALARLLPDDRTSRPLFVMTNMHADMPGTYAGTQAGFNTSDTEKTLAGNSYPHKIADVVRGAKGAGWTFVSVSDDEVLEKEVERWMVCDESDEIDQGQTKFRRGHGMLGPRGEKWIGVKCWFGALLQRDDGSS